MMLATRKRNRPRPKARLPQFEQLEDRRVFNASWQIQPPPPPTITFTQIVVVVQWVPIPVAAQGVPTGAGQGIGASVSAWAHEGIHGQDLAALIHQPQGKVTPTDVRGGDDGGGLGDGGNSGGGSAGSSGGPTAGGTGGPGGPVTTGGTGTGSSQGSGGQDGGTGSTPPPAHGGGSTAPQSSGGTDQGATAGSASPVEVQSSPARAHEVSTAATAAPVANGQAAPATSAVLLAEALAARGETVADRSVVLHHERDLVVRADLHPTTVSPVLNSTNSSNYNTVRVDSLPGGTEQPAFAPRGQESGSGADVPQPDDPNAPAHTAQAKVAKTRPDGGSGQDKTETSAEPQEAGLLTKVPLAAVPPLGLEQALRRLKDLLADLTTGRALLHALPLTGAAVVLGGAAFGLLRWRRKKRRTKKDVPDAAPDEEEKDTWLPGSGNLPPVDPA